MHDSAVKPGSIRLLSLNITGISNFHKCWASFAWCRKQKADAIFLQETHSTAEWQDQWRKEWGSSHLFSHWSTNARNGLDITIQQWKIGSNGRFIVIKAVINNINEVYTIVNIHDPNNEVEAVTFYCNWSKLFRKNELADENTVMSSGYNTWQPRWSTNPSEIWNQN